MTRRQSIITAVGALLCPKLAPSSPAVTTLMGVDIGAKDTIIAAVWQFSVQDIGGKFIGTYEIPADQFEKRLWCAASGNQSGKSAAQLKMMEQWIKTAS